ncbi:MAG TPA: ATP-binding cassette domain-containing protein, partial [Terrimesophilobacter sp.]|nr:ATP-binding cassette domain-containing protein [Terrimesophilobacter sp.]
TTTLRMLLGLVTPTSGTATIGGTAYRDLDSPLTTVGTALEASSFHPGRTARNHLNVYAAAAGIPARRSDEVLTQVGLDQYGDRRVGGYSLGMRQRLGLAFALLGDPRVLVLDEPVNGLDPEGIRWIRMFLRDLAAEGRTVLISSHLLSEVQQSVDRLVIISRGRLVYEGGLADLGGGGGRVMIDAIDRDRLAAALTGAGAQFTLTDDGFSVTGQTAAELGQLTLTAGIALNRLSAESTQLEASFLELVQDGSLASRGDATSEGGTQ